MSSNFCMSQAAVGQRSAQSPQWTQRSSSFTMMRAVCGNGSRRKEILIRIIRRRRKTGPQFLFVAIARNGEALHADKRRYRRRTQCTWA